MISKSELFQYPNRVLQTNFYLQRLFVLCFTVIIETVKFNKAGTDFVEVCPHSVKDIVKVKALFC